MNHHVSCQNHIFSWSIHGQISVLSQCFTIAHHVSRCFIIFHHQVRPPRCGERLGFMGDITQLGQFHHLLRPSIQGKNHQQASDYWSGMNHYESHDESLLSASRVILSSWEAIINHYTGVGKCPNVSHHPKKRGYFISNRSLVWWNKSPTIKDINPNPCVVI